MGERLRELELEHARFRGALALAFWLVPVVTAVLSAGAGALVQYLGGK